MAEFRISVELGHLIGLRASIRRENFPFLAKAVQTVAEEAHRTWHAFASGVPMPDGKSVNARSGDYARSILLRQTGDFEAEVYSMLPYAAAIEDGSPARDLKRMLNTSLKVRLSKKGKRYLIIPFRHGHPNSVMGNNMPRVVHDWWKSKARSSSHIKGEFLRPSGTGAFDIKTRKPIMVPAWKYKWGTKLSRADLADLGISGKHGRRLEGMYRFRKLGGKAGYGQHTQFITFRVMSEGKPGWITRAKPGLYPARQTAALMRPIAEDVFAEAMAEDIQRLFS